MNRQKDKTRKQWNSYLYDHLPGLFQTKNKTTYPKYLGTIETSANIHILSDTTIGLRILLQCKSARGTSPNLL